MAMVRRMLRRLERQGRKAEPGVLMTFVSGASWSGERCSVFGYVVEQYQHGAADTEFRRLWGSCAARASGVDAFGRANI